MVKKIRLPKSWKNKTKPQKLRWLEKDIERDLHKDPYYRAGYMADDGHFVRESAQKALRRIDKKRR